jgi:uncharacterized protein YndB with AHSA1/START domain
VASAHVERVFKTLLVRNRSEIRLESRLAVRARHDTGTTTDVGQILAFDPPRRLSYTFQHVLNDEMRNEKPSTVVFNIEQHGNFAKLTLTHEGFAEGSKLLDGISKGWPAILSSLKSLLESGTALEIPVSALGIEGVS